MTRNGLEEVFAIFFLCYSTSDVNFEKDAENEDTCGLADTNAEVFQNRFERHNPSAVLPCLNLTQGDRVQATSL
jgi:hypothetical protein